MVRRFLYIRNCLLIFQKYLSRINISFSVNYLGGIPVPGRNVPAKRFFELYASSCLPNSRRSPILQQIVDLIENVDTEEFASKIYNSIYFSIADIDIIKMLGEWQTVVDSPAIYGQRCVIANYELLNNNAYTATFSIRQYSWNNDEISMFEGYGTKTGTDPGGVLILTGHPSDPCPYSPIFTGPINEDGLYDYIILSQPLKYPTMVLARDPITFNSKHKKQVKEFLDKYHFWNAVSALNNELSFVNASNCLISQYSHVD
uniref:Lipocalin/cytosolic fatty-acid binding domain-containing protein n=1 Tax=Ascaris lumbricoides TaxID=6252 RepID=A0A0M3HZV8_ASCLU